MLTAGELLASREFKQLVSRRWRVSGLLTAALFTLYYGFILLVATNRALLATRVGPATTLGIVLGVTVLVGAWLLTGVYVAWANREFDPEVQRLRERLRHEVAK
jgi:uncharacterized membrane protein (DUF485 family)